MRFNRFVVLPLALLALGALPACSNEDDNNTPDSGTANPDSGTFEFPDAGADPGTSPAGTCPAGAIICENFEQGTNGWTASETHATIQASNGRLHVVTENGHNEDTVPGGVQAIAKWEKSMPAFGTQLFVRAHVYMDSLPAVFGQMGTFFVLFSLDENDFGGLELQGISDRGIALDNWTGRGTGWNRSPTPVTAGLTARRWMCLEWEIRRATATSSLGTARAYVDSNLVYEFTDVGMRGFTRFTTGYGFVHPKGQSASETFIDNVVVSNISRVGCL
ncbi:hypothetical protein ACLESD_30180 [Pyxidicoccus sp. 3LFB2]